jgi:hypothetical protein
METNTKGRIQARDAAMRLLNRITVGVAFGAVAGVGLLGAVSAQTVPGTTSTSSSTTSAPTSSSPASTSASNPSLGSPSTPVASSSSSGVAVSGGS